MSKETMFDLDLGFCDACDSWVSIVYVDGDYLCKSEYEMYPDLATVIR